jgi:hypothetical protein
VDREACAALQEVDKHLPAGVFGGSYTHSITMQKKFPKVAHYQLNEDDRKNRA